MMASRFGKVVTALFTTLVAPVLVSVIIQELSISRGSPVSASHATSSPTGGTGSREIVISHGLGATPAQARQEALRGALHQVIASLNAGTTVVSNEQAVCEAVLREPQSVILRCEDLACHKQASAGRELYCQEISVEVARDALARRLRTMP